MSGPKYYIFHHLPPLKYKGTHPMRGVFIEAVDALEDDDRRAINMRFWENLTYREIAENLGLSAKQSGHYRVKRALWRLEEELAERGVLYDE